MTSNYWDDPQHASWQEHYTHGQYGVVLGFTREFREQHMPKDMAHSNHEHSLVVELVLAKEKDDPAATVYLDRHVVAYEHDDRLLTLLDADWNPVRVHSLMTYFYGGHYCGCHRLQGAVQRGGYVEQEKDREPPGDHVCSDIHFRVKKIYWEQRPELILYSETLDTEQLEELLAKTRGTHANT